MGSPRAALELCRFFSYQRCACQQRHIWKSSDDILCETEFRIQWLLHTVHHHTRRLPCLLIEITSTQNHSCTHIVATFHSAKNWGHSVPGANCLAAGSGSR